MSWDLSCPDWVDRLKSGRSLVPTLPLDMRQADRAVAVFNKLRLADVPGNPTMAEAGGDWYRDIVRALFGSLDPVTKQRMIREVFALVAKKNSKTTNSALLMLVALLLNERPQASLIMTAPVQDVAHLAFDAVAGAIALDPVLEKKLYVRDHLKKVIHRETKAELEIMSFDPAALTGQKPVAVLIDELHVVAKMAKAASALRQLRGGMLPFPEAFLMIITTQSEEAPVGVMASELQKARDIRDGKRRGPMLPVLFEFPTDMQAMPRDGSLPAWRDSANWPMVTPNLGRSISLAALKEGFEDAEHKGEAELRAWASQHLNVQIGVALSSSEWAGAEFWERRADSRVTLDYLLANCDVICAGIDGGGLDDLLGLVLIGRHRETREWLLWAQAWAHRIVLSRRKAIAEKLLDLERCGDLKIVENPGEDVREVADLLVRVRDEGLLPEKLAIGVDAAGIGDIVDELTSEDRGFTLEQIIAIAQGWKLNGAIKSLERRLAGGGLIHGGQPLMSWAVGNAKVEPKGNAITITKQASGSAKIDPLMAAFNAAQLLALNPAGSGKSFWEAA